MIPQRVYAIPADALFGGNRGLHLADHATLLDLQQRYAPLVQRCTPSNAGLAVYTFNVLAELDAALARWGGVA